MSLRRLIRRLQEDSQFLRGAIQGAFAALCVWIGVEFYLFIRWGASGRLFGAITGAAMLTGHWHNAMSYEEYLYPFQRLDSYQHFQGRVPEWDPND